MLSAFSRATRLGLIYLIAFMSVLSAPCDTTVRGIHQWGQDVRPVIGPEIWVKSIRFRIGSINLHGYPPFHTPLLRCIGMIIMIVTPMTSHRKGTYLLEIRWYMIWYFDYPGNKIFESLKKYCSRDNTLNQNWLNASKLLINLLRKPHKVNM